MEVAGYLKEQGVLFEKHQHAPATTAMQLAEAENVPAREVAKPMILKGSRGFVMCVLPASAELDLRRVAEVLGDSSVRLATKEELAWAIRGCELGALPPIGTLFNLETITDTSISSDEYLTMAAGSIHESIRLRRSDWERVARPTFAAIAFPVWAESTGRKRMVTLPRGLHPCAPKFTPN